MALLPLISTVSGHWAIIKPCRFVDIRLLLLSSLQYMKETTADNRQTTRLDDGQ